VLVRFIIQGAMSHTHFQHNQTKLHKSDKVTTFYGLHDFCYFCLLLLE